jgi:hypothetical protein
MRFFPPERGGYYLRDKVFRESNFDPALTAIGRDGVNSPKPTIHDLRHFAGTRTARVGNLVETMAASATKPYKHPSSIKQSPRAATPKSQKPCLA